MVDHVLAGGETNISVEESLMSKNLPAVAAAEVVANALDGLQSRLADLITEHLTGRRRAGAFQEELDTHGAMLQGKEKEKMELMRQLAEANQRLSAQVIILLESVCPQLLFALN